MVFLAPLLAPGALSTGATTGAGSYALQAGGQQAMGEYSKPPGGSYIEEGPNPHDPGTERHAEWERAQVARQQMAEADAGGGSPYAMGFMLGAGLGAAGVGPTSQAAHGVDGGPGPGAFGNPASIPYGGTAGGEYLGGEAAIPGFGSTGKGSRATVEGFTGAQGGEGIKAEGDKLFGHELGGKKGGSALPPEGTDLSALGFDPEMFAGLWA